MSKAQCGAGHRKEWSVITGLALESTILWLFSLDQSSGALGHQPSYWEGHQETPARSGAVAKAFRESQVPGAWEYSIRSVECGDSHKGDLINSIE